MRNWNQKRQRNSATGVKRSNKRSNDHRWDATRLDCETQRRERHDHRDVDALDNCADRLGPGWPTRLQTYTTTTSFKQVKITLKMQKNILFN